MTAIILMAWLALPAPPQARLSDEQIDQVIAYAQTAEGYGGVRCYATAPPGGNSTSSEGVAVMLTGPAGRIFDAVKAAEARGLTFTRADVTPEMAATTLTVLAYPDAPKEDASGRHDAPRATGIVIRTGGPHPLAVKPRSIRTLPGRGLQATFQYQDFATIRLGDFEVVVAAGRSERVCTIDSAARESIR